MNVREVLTITTDADPTVTMRISALIAVDNAIPELLSAIDLRDGTMRVVVVMRETSMERVAYLAKKLESTIPSVIKVTHTRGDMDARTLCVTDRILVCYS